MEIIFLKKNSTMPLHSVDLIRRKALAEDHFGKSAHITHADIRWVILHNLSDIQLSSKAPYLYPFFLQFFHKK